MKERGIDKELKSVKFQALALYAYLLSFRNKSYTASYLSAAIAENVNLAKQKFESVSWRKKAWTWCN